MLEGISLEALGGGGAFVAFIVAMLLWRVFKMALKIVLFVVVMAVLAAGVAIYLEKGGSRLRLPAPNALTAP